MILNIEPSSSFNSPFGTIRINNEGYFSISSGKEGNNKKLFHRMLFEKFYGQIPDGYVIHHKDKNRLNCCIFNLQLMKQEEHCRFHNTGENNPKYWKGKIRKDTAIKLSKLKSGTGFYRVHKYYNKKYAQGFIWVYQYSDNNKKRKKLKALILTLLKKKLKKKD